MLEPRELQRWQREIDAMLVKAGNDDPETFAAIVRLLDNARSKLPYAAAALREAGENDAIGQPGYSWANIADALGVTRSAAQQRFALR